MPSLDSCISDIFEPGNTATDSGTVTTPRYSGYLLTAEGKRIIIRSTTPPSDLDNLHWFIFQAYWVVGRVLRLG